MARYKLARAMVAFRLVIKYKVLKAKIPNILRRARWFLGLVIRIFLYLVVALLLAFLLLLLAFLLLR